MCYGAWVIIFFSSNGTLFFTFSLASLGSTRFLKVARATHSDGTEVVVKVFAKNDPLLQLDGYKNALMEIYRKLYTTANALPFQHFWVSIV